VTASRILALLLAGLLLGGCETLAYYAQSAGGQLRLMGKAESIDELLDGPDTTPALAERLRLSQRLRDFATTRLALPDNGSYRSYADVGRRAVLWSVVATPAYDLTPKRWCYPLIGCVSYRGYFERADADAEASRLRAEGMDVAVLPVPAYSTLGWFRDPLPSTVIHWPEPELAGLMFHELAHQRIYIADDTAFNESYASAVARLGIGLWLADQPQLLAEWQAREARATAVSRLLLATREQLTEAFAQAGSDDRRQRLKSATYARLADDYRTLSAAWPAPRPYAHWFTQGGINNAYLAQVANYDQWLPAFERLWAQQGDDPAAFHRAVEALGALSPDERRRRLQALSAARAAP
jgi:predicted aminopeptidase